MYRLDELTPNAVPRRQFSAKRKNDFESPAAKKVSRPETVKKPSANGEGPQYVYLAFMIE